MRLTSVQELKTELMSFVRTTYTKVREARGRSATELRKARASRDALSQGRAAARRADSVVRVKIEQPKPVLAVGVAPTTKQREYRLAVRAFRGAENEQAARAIIARARVPENEVDLAVGLRYTPRVTVRAGTSIGHFRITSGTLGGFVEDGTNYYMLSNNHVLANSDECAVGDPILLPGPADIVGDRFIVVGRLHSWVPLAHGKGKVDAALATFTDEAEFFYPWTYRGIGEMQREPVADRFETRRVVKLGITTGKTLGEVSAFDLDGIAIDYSEAGDESKVVTFDNQLEFVGSPASRPFSQPGDSGSMILDARSKKPYALLYAGGPDDKGIDRTLGHFLPEVLEELGVRIVQ